MQAVQKKNPVAAGGPERKARSNFCDRRQEPGDRTA